MGTLDQKKHASKATPRPNADAVGASRGTSSPRPSGGPPSKAETTPKTSTYEARMRQLAPIVRLQKKLEATAKHFSILAREVRRWENARNLGETATKIEAAVAEMLADTMMVPDSFQPQRTRRGNHRQLTSGTKVILRERVLGKYSALLEYEAASTLEVVSVSRANVAVKSGSGALIVLPRAHVARLGAPASSPTDVPTRPSDGFGG